MKKIFVICLSFVCLNVFGQNAIKGFVYDATSTDALMFVNIIIENTKLGTVTDENGYFIINNVPSGERRLKVQSIGYSDTVIIVNTEKNSTLNLNIHLQRQAKQLQTVEIYGERELARTESRVSVKKISASDIQKIPSIGGQSDIAQYIQVLPGVVFSGDQGGQLYIRGGSAVQNKVLLDGMIIYNPFHSIGLFSVFETDIIRNADIYTSGFNAKYGSRISSIMDITTKDGNKKRTTGKVGISGFGASALLEGPIIKENDSNNLSLSYILTAKNSYLSKTSKNIYSYIDNELPYDFFDLYGKVTLASKSGSKISAFGFNFTDKVNAYKDIADFNWRNSGFGSNFIIVPPSSSALIEGTLAYSDYEMNMQQTDDNSEQKSKINSFNGNLNAKRFFNKNKLEYGVDIVANTTKTQYENTEEFTDYSTDLGIYTVFKGFLFNNKFLYEPSLRFTYYASWDEAFVEPRLSLKYNLTDNFRLKAATGMYSQTIIDTKSDRDIVNLFTGYLTGSTDLYGGVVSSYRGKSVDSYVAKSNHYIIGAELDITKRLSMNIELYYKTMSNLISVNRDRLYNDDNDHRAYSDYLKKAFSVEDATAYGGDISLKYSDGRLYVWTIYSYGKVEKKGEIINYSPHYDRRHNVNVLVSYQMGMDRSWEVSFRWNYGSGFPYTATRGFAQNLSFSDGLSSDYVTSSGSLMTVYGGLNQKRLPAYHRLDISLKKRFEIIKNTTLEIEASVTNVYDRNNLFYYDRVTSQRVDQLPIMPSLSVNIRF